jgi:hypothetical protein
VIYLGTSPNSHPTITSMLDNHEIGLMCQPKSNLPRPGWIWAADNGCFGGGSQFDDKKWLAWLSKPHPRTGCLFASVPDVVGDHQGTLYRWRTYAPKVRDLGYPLAFVLQDGASVDTVPWDQFDTLFVGGTTGFKQGIHCLNIAKDAKARGKWVHVGRVNSYKRLAYWNGVADSADGTHLAFDPTNNVQHIKQWMSSLKVARQSMLDVTV